ncbi:concanavalin A-like lectin/glucanase [Guyanagaster necrorhizus]|uniref:Concanavalin A-like lectin/glucanase n=1 Tax=Guyanagaster necrorhizus TaxID=856835 RepID=A0A9P7VGU9_9AGAR|nr:concanavalin A-like lectin/glucanase [Guyanagaster necrorhizus MCA 3950]KAG7440469.1 concanavalin A-like lectin/glucanase [Guyanagaster necrorhizus MCA 3950]
MISLSTISTVLCFIGLIFAAPYELQKRLDTSIHCGQYDSVNAGMYTLYLNQWGENAATSGQSCAAVTSTSGDNVSWTTSWTWSGSGGDGVKSYTNIDANNGLNSSWIWSQTISGTIIANVAYDLFTSSSAGGSNEYEIMIWLDNINAKPISYNYDVSGAAIAIVKDLFIAGYKWDLYYGSNGSNFVYSFLTSDQSAVKGFNGDLMDFFNYLTSKQGLSASQYLITAQGGTEATQGSATLKS